MTNPDDYLFKLLSALIAAFYTARLAQRAAARERRRQLYGEAFKAALAWKELYFRVRRRRDTIESRYALVQHFHELQETLDYHKGWISTESKPLWRSYCGLVGKVKREYEPLIQKAWDRNPIPPGKNFPQKELDSLPALSKPEERFLRDVRWHLSLFPLLLKWWVRWVNRKVDQDVYR